jgi:glycogen debranching enzyme
MNPLAEKLFEELAIAVPRGRVAQYFFGDSLDGYYEGFTHRTAEGAGYVQRRRSVFRDFLSWRGDLPNKREKAEGARIYPYGIRHLHGPTWWDELMVLRRRRAVALRVVARQPAQLAIAPLIDIPPDKMDARQDEGAVLLWDHRKTVYIGVSSSQPFRFAGEDKEGRMFAPVFRTVRDVTEFTLYLAFARDPQTALAQAIRLREDDGVLRHKEAILALLTKSNLWTNDEAYNRALAWAKLSSLFMVTEEFGKGIWAGLPWFKDNWGRDTFIALPGTLLASGCFDDARDVIRNFLRYQNRDKKSSDYGRVPNRVAGPRDIIYNTTDGTPWLIREILEYLQYTGDASFAADVYPAVTIAIEGAIKNHVDAKGLLTHDDADTWMDARIEGKTPWSPRGNRANDIQVLFFSALLAGARLAAICKDKSAEKKWTMLAARAQKSFLKLFWDAKKKRMADRVDAKGKADFKVRPNQLMLVSVPLKERFIPDEIEQRVVRNAASELLYPHGIASLSQDDPWFHPHHHHEDKRYHFDAAYHNGTVWGWNAGFTTTALLRHGHVETAWQLAQNLADQILNLGCRGAMSELVEAVPDKNGKITLSGTWAQAWSTSEFARNGYQDFGGFRPRLLDGELVFEPKLPAAWDSFSATFPFGRDATFVVAFTRQLGKEVYVLRMEGYVKPLRLRARLPAGGKMYVVERDLRATESLMLVVDAKRAIIGVNGQWELKPPKGEKIVEPAAIKFVKPSLAAKPGSLREQDFLRRILEPAQAPRAKQSPSKPLFKGAARRTKHRPRSKKEHHR